MLRLFHYNSKPCARNGILRLRIDNFGSDIFNVVVSIRALDSNFFKGSLREKSQTLGDIKSDRSKFIKIPYVTTFPTGIAEFSVYVSYSETAHSSNRILEAGVFSLEIKDLTNQITNTTYHIENKNVLHTEGNGIAYLGDSSTNIPSSKKQSDSDEQECNVPLSILDTKKLTSPFLCEIESAKRLQSGKINFIKINFNALNPRDVDAFSVVNLSGQVDLGGDVESFVVDKFSTVDGLSISARIKVNIPESVTQISLGNFLFEISRGTETEYYASAKNFECFFDSLGTSTISDFDDYYNLPLRREENPKKPKQMDMQNEKAYNSGYDFVQKKPFESYSQPAQQPNICYGNNGNVQPIPPTFHIPPVSNVQPAVNVSPMYNVAQPYQVPPMPNMPQNYQVPPVSHVAQNYQVPPMPSVVPMPQVVPNYVSNFQNNSVVQPQSDNIQTAVSQVSESQTIEEILAKADLMYGDGENVRDEKVAFEMYEKASKIGSPYADYRLGECYLRGIGVFPSSSKAFRFFKLAADKDIPEAAFRCYECYCSRMGVEYNVSLAIRYLRTASSFGYARAKGILAQRHLFGDDCDQNTQIAFDLANDGLKAGDINSIYVLAYMYFFGHGVPEDFSKAATYAEIASSAGHLGASYIYAECLRRGAGVEQNIEKSESIFRKIVKQSDSLECALAMDTLGTILLARGKKEEAIDCFAEAAEAGYTKSLFRLAKIFATGDGVPSSPTVAFEMFSLLAKTGNREATLELAESYLRGRGITKNEAEAYKLADSVLASGNPHAMYLVGMMKITGKGTSQDAGYGRQLLKKSADMGFVPAQKCLARLGG